MDTGKGRARRRNLQPDLRILGNLYRLGGLVPGLGRLVVQIETPLGFPYARPDAVELPADARLGILRQCNLAPENMEDRRFGPVIGIAEIQIERPVLLQLRTRFDLNHGASL